MSDIAREDSERQSLLADPNRRNCPLRLERLLVSSTADFKEFKMKIRRCATLASLLFAVSLNISTSTPAFAYPQVHNEECVNGEATITGKMATPIQGAGLYLFNIDPLKMLPGTPFPIIAGFKKCVAAGDYFILFPPPRINSKVEIELCNNCNVSTGKSEKIVNSLVQIHATPNGLVDLLIVTP